MPPKTEKANRVQMLVAVPLCLATLVTLGSSLVSACTSVDGAAPKCPPEATIVAPDAAAGGATSSTDPDQDPCRTYPGDAALPTGGTSGNPSNTMGAGGAGTTTGAGGDAGAGGN